MRCAWLTPRGEPAAGRLTGAGGRAGGRRRRSWGVYQLLQRSGRGAGWGGVSPESGAISVPRGECRPPEERLGSARLAAGGEGCPRRAGGSVRPSRGSRTPTSMQRASEERLSVIIKDLHVWLCLGEPMELLGTPERPSGWRWCRSQPLPGVRAGQRVRASGFAPGY